MIDSEQGKKLGDEVWKEMVEVFRKEAPDIEGVISAS